MLALVLPGSLSQASNPDSDQPSSILRNQPSASPNNRRLYSYRGSGNLWYSIKIFFFFCFFSKTTMGHSFLGGRGRMERGEKNNRKNKSNLQSSGTSQISVTLHRWFQAPIPKCLGLSVCPGCVGLSEEQQLGLCMPQVTELQFEVAAMGLSSSRSMLELAGCRLL